MKFWGRKASGKTIHWLQAMYLILFCNLLKNKKILFSYFLYKKDGQEICIYEQILTNANISKKCTADESRDRPSEVSVGMLSEYAEMWQERPRPTWIPGKVMELLILEAFSMHVEDKKMIRSNEHMLTKGKSCLINLIAFYDVTTGWVDEEKAVDTTFLTSARCLTTSPTTSL